MTNPIKNNLAKVFACTCSHPSQDSIYGKNRRLWNPCVTKGSKRVGFRCTVCGREREADSAEAKLLTGKRAQDFASHVD